MAQGRADIFGECLGIDRGVVTGEIEPHIMLPGSSYVPLIFVRLISYLYLLAYLSAGRYVCLSVCLSAYLPVSQ